MTSGDNKKRDKKPNPLRPNYFWHPNELSFCGYSGSGKTTLIYRLTNEFSKQFKVGYLKHDVHNFEIDKEGKDTQRISSSGAHKVIISDSGKHAQVTSGSVDLLSEKLSFSECDFLLIEGYKNGPADKIVMLDEKLEILPRIASGEIDRVVAYVGAGERPLVLPSGAPYFQRDKVDEIKSFIDEHFANKVKAIPLNALVLTGGFSTRMKKDKALLNYHGQTQAEFVFNRLSKFCDKVYLSSRKGQWDEPALNNLPQIHDRLLGFGPMGGILSAMQEAPEAAWLVVACDLPFLDDATVEHLISQRDPYKLATAYTSSSDGLPEPLCAIYEPRSRATLYQYLGLGYQCPRKVLLNSHVKILELRNAKALDNANHEYEFLEFKEKLGRPDKGNVL